MRIERWPPAFPRTALDGLIKDTLVLRPYQCPNRSRRVVFADGVFHIQGSPIHLLAIYAADRRLFVGRIILAYAASLKQTLDFERRKFRGFFTGSARLIRSLSDSPHSLRS